MHRATWALVASAFLIAIHAEAADFRDLFNGKDFEGWVIDGPTTRKEGSETRTIWSVKDGMIVADAGKSGYGFLRYDAKQFSDFVFHVEYRFVPASDKQPSGNSGLGIRTIAFDPKRSQQTRPSYACYEIQLLDDAGKPANKHGSGSLYRYAAPSSNPTRPAPEWNTIDVECAGSRLRVTLNGTKIIDVDQNTLDDLPEKERPKGVPAPKDKPLRGYVCLQSHTGTVEFRQVKIAELAEKSR